MEKFVIIIFLFISFASTAQDKTIHVEIYENGDTSLYYEWNKKLCKELQLESILNSKKKSHFRLWTNRQVLDLYQDENSIRKGTITSWVKESVWEEEEPTNRIFQQTIVLTAAIVNDLYQLIDSSKVDTIPDEHLIEGWSNGFDGITYIFESANEKDYFFKTYWSPYTQEGLEQAMLIQEFIDKALELSNSKIIWNNFSKEIPFESYYVGSSFVAKILTKRERRKYKRERNRYRRKMKEE